MKKTFLMSCVAGGAVILFSVLSIHKVPSVLAQAETQEEKTPKQGLVRKILNPGRAAIGSGVISAKGADVLTVTKDGKTYTVNIDNKTRLFRRFGGKTTLEEMQTGDTVHIVGKWEDEAKTIIQAIMVRDASIQKRYGIFFGMVATVTGDTYTVNTDRRGVQSVTVGKTTRFINRRGQKISEEDVKVGDRIRIRGLWNNTNATVTEVTEIKDFNLPVVISPTLKVSE